MIVVSDTSPLQYLILLEAEFVLPALYGRVAIPAEVLAELRADGSPARVQHWLNSLPAWLEVHPSTRVRPPAGIHAGEAAAIGLAEALKADLLLMDDKDGRHYAEGRGLRVTGLLGVLRDAGNQRLLDFKAKVHQLEAETNFRMSPWLRDRLLREGEGGRN